MISWKKSYLRVFGLGNFLNFLNVQDWSEERGLPRFSKRQVSESLFDLKDPKRLERWLNVPSFPNILQTLHVITDMMMHLNPHQSSADMNACVMPWGTSPNTFRLSHMLPTSLLGWIDFFTTNRRSKTQLKCFVQYNLYSIKYQLFRFRPELLMLHKLCN